MKEIYEKIKWPNEIDFEGWIRFEIGMEDISDDRRYLESAYARSYMLFKEIFDDEDDILLVVDAPIWVEYIEYWNYDAPVELKKELLPYIKNPKVKDEIKFIKGEEGSFNTDEEMIFYRCILECKVKDINYTKLLTSICNKDMGVEPRYESRPHFFHKNKQIQYFLYDDRGLDLNSINKSSLRDIYYKYNKWILNYDRKVIDGIFKK